MNNSGLMKSPVLGLENMGPQAREFIREVSSMSTLNYFGLSVGCDGISTSRVESLMKRRLSFLISTYKFIKNVDK